MTPSIYLINQHNALTELQERAYDSEALLQKLLADHPGVLAGNTSSDAAQRWLLITREASVPDAMDGPGRWSVDHLFLDQNAVPTLVEVKRSSDTRIRREVVGQMLDYAANAVAYWPVDRLRSVFESRCAAQGIDAEEELTSFLATGALADEEAFWERAKNNLQAGKIRLVFVADMIPPELQRVVEFLNAQMDPAEVLALEVKQYVSGDLRTLVPTLIGRTAEAAQRKSSGGTVNAELWNESKFFEHLSNAHPDSRQQVARDLLVWAQANVSSVWWGRGRTMGSFVPILQHHATAYQLFAVWSTGTIEFYFQWLAVKPGFRDEAPRRELMARLNAIPGVSIPSDAIKRRPTVQLSVFSNPTSRQALFDTLNWVIGRIHEMKADDVRNVDAD